MCPLWKVLEQSVDYRFLFETEEKRSIGCASFLYIMWRRLSKVLTHFVGKNEEEFNFLFTLLLDARNDRGWLTFLLLKHFHMKVIFKEIASNPGNLEFVWGTFKVTSVFWGRLGQHPWGVRLRCIIGIQLWKVYL